MLQEEQGQGAAPGNAGGQPQRQGQDSHSVFIPPQQNAPGPNILAAPSRVPNNNSQPLPRQVPPREGADLAGMMQGLNIEEHNQKNRVSDPQGVPLNCLFSTNGQSHIITDARKCALGGVLETRVILYLHEIICNELN